MKVLITDYVHQLLIENLEKSGFEVTYLPDIELNGVKEIIKDYSTIVINTKTKMDKDMIDKAISLKLIVRLGSGLDIIDLEYAETKGIIVENTPEGNRNAVAEHALGLLLSLMNNIVVSNCEVKNLQWKREINRGTELEGKTIGIIGFGNTGSSFAKKLQGFDMKVLVYDKYKQRFGEKFRYLEETKMDQLFEECDILSLHIPLTDETKYLVDSAFINRFKKKIYLINTSRGKIVKIQDILKALSLGKIKGAALDVLENEKPFTYSKEEEKLYKTLFSMKNVIVTPHIAGWTFESKEKIAKYTFNKILNLCN